MSPVLAAVTANQLRDVCGRDPEFLCRELYEATGSRTLAEAAALVTGTPLTILLIVLGAVIVNRMVGRAIDRGLRSLSSGVVRERLGAVSSRAPRALLQPSETTLRTDQRISAITSVLRSVTGFVILLFACFAVLSELSVQVAPLLAGAGVVGVALGFGSQSLVKDFLSGLFILIEDQFGVGDLVELDGTTKGVVEAISLRTTRLRAEDGTVWHLPNGAIIRVGNHSQRRETAGEEAAVDVVEPAPEPDDDAPQGPEPDPPARRDDPPAR